HAVRRLAGVAARGVVVPEVVTARGGRRRAAAGAGTGGARRLAGAAAFPRRGVGRGVRAALVARRERAVHALGGLPELVVDGALGPRQDAAVLEDDLVLERPALGDHVGRGVLVGLQALLERGHGPGSEGADGRDVLDVQLAERLEPLQ